MPFILIKNNLKLMLRSKWILILMIILPLVTIALLANAFREMLDSAYKMEEFKVGYRVEKDSGYKALMEPFQTVCKENSIILQEFPEGEIEVLLKSEAVAVFVDIKAEDSYVIYKSNNRNTEAAITENIFANFFYQVNEAKSLANYSRAITEIPEIKAPQVLLEKLKTDPLPSSTDYYGIVYIVYFAWCGMVSLVAVISSERKSAIPKRMKVSHQSNLSYYLGKFIPCTLAIFLEVSAAWALSVILYDIHWGNITLSAFIIFLVSMGSSAFGIVLFQLFRNVGVGIVLGFVITWVAGFFGGCFQTYMYAHLPKVLVELSPFYYLNRTLIEHSVKGYSDYTAKCILMLLGIIVVFSVIGVFMINRKTEEAG
jgi:ABC-2 type transport system permease protein